MPASLYIRLLVAVALAFASACPSESRGAGRDGGASRGSGEPGSHGRVGVKVPLPSGWTVRVEQDQSLAFGPPGHKALRVDIRPGRGKYKPTDKKLENDFKSALEYTRAIHLEGETTKDTTIVLLALVPKDSDGGTMEERRLVMLGAKQVGEDLFLCASEPGATPEEVELATEACRSISIPPSGR